MAARVASEYNSHHIFELHFVSRCFYLARKILVAFAIFATFGDFSRPFLAFFLSKSKIWWTVLFLLFLRYLLLGVFSLQEKSLLLLQFFRHLLTFRGPSWPFLFLCSCDSCDSYDNCYSVLLTSKKNPLYLILRLLRHLRTFRGLFCFLVFNLVTFAEYSCDFCDTRYQVLLASKKNPCYFCDFFDICGLVGALLGLFSF